MTYVEKHTPQQVNYWDYPLGGSGLAGQTREFTVTPQVDFRVEKVIATDSDGGNATRVKQFIVGQRIQRPTSQGSTLLQFFGPGVLGNGVGWDTCQKGCIIGITLEFVKDATVDITLFGRAVH